MDFIVTVILESWAVLVESSPYMIFGFAAAGLLKAFLPEAFIAKHLSAASTGSTLKAALIGAPLPLWSCGVIPAAAEIRRSGASKGATASFLISTPETGMDSIAVTYALMGPFMAIIRPIAAIFTAAFTGLFVNAFDVKDQSNRTIPDFVSQPIPLATLETTQSGGWVSGLPVAGATNSIWKRALAGLKYAFTDLLRSIGLWFLLGILIAGLISALIPPGFLESNVGDGLFSMLLMLVVGLPLYVCATASTPVAAALALKGLSPGAALVFLLAGPATNTATIAVAAKILGKRAAIIYVVSICLCSIGAGVAVNFIYTTFGFTVIDWIVGSTHAHTNILSLISAAALLSATLWAVLSPCIFTIQSDRQKRKDRGAW